MPQLNKKIKELEKERLVLQKMRGYTIIGIVIIALVSLSYGVYWFVNGFPPAMAFPLIAGIACSQFYKEKISIPHDELLAQLKAGFVTDYMEVFHPRISYRYQYAKKRGARMVKSVGAIDFDICEEEDVLEGHIEGAKFYISELNLRKSDDDGSYRVFKGVMMNISVTGRTFPGSKIDTDRSGFANFFEKYHHDTDYDIHFETDNKEQFEDHLRALFPFVSSIREHSNRVRILTKANELTLFLDTDSKFMDDPVLGTTDSFYNKDFADNLTKDLNTMLYMVEALSKNLSESQVEERLKLKALELMKSKA